MTIHRNDLDAGRVDFTDVIDASTSRALPPSPGEMLREEFMKPLGLSANKLATEIGVPPNRITAILNGDRSITADTAIRLARRFGVSAEMWMGFQADYDLAVARQELVQA